MTASLYALPYLGGKAASQRSGGLCRWIVSLMPSCRSYIETHGGMYGVGLARPPSANETLNDLDCRVVNWWRQLRDHGDELIRRAALTPDSRAEYERALDLLDDDDPMLAARATSVVLMQSLRSSLRSEPSSWARSRHGPAPQRGRHPGRRRPVLQPVGVGSHRACLRQDL